MNFLKKLFTRPEEKKELFLYEVTIMFLYEDIPERVDSKKFLQIIGNLNGGVNGWTKHRWFGRFNENICLFSYQSTEVMLAGKKKGIAGQHVRISKELLGREMRFVPEPLVCVSILYKVAYLEEAK